MAGLFRRLPVSFAFLVFIAIAVWLYLPGIQGPPLLDDRSSLAHLSDVAHEPQRALELILGDSSGPLGRPVSIATFVAERAFFNADYALSKLLNVVLHTFNSLLVVFVFYLMLHHAGYPKPAWLAVLGGAIWLFSPLFVSTVLYTVQRMAMLATMFMLLSLLSYVTWRCAFLTGRKHWFLLVLAFLFMLLGLFSKENAIVILPVIVALEIMWFTGVRNSLRRGRHLGNVAWLVAAIGMMFLASLIAFAPGIFLDGYVNREFSLVERLLTESRVLWDYVAQFFWPEVRRMGLFHDDFEISRSLREPITTLYAVVGWIVLLGVVALASVTSWGSRVGFSVIFFLLGHSAESTILPLEIYYEHRNYFPAVGLALLPAVLIGELSLRGRELANPLLAWGVGLVLILAMQTSSQVQVWSSETILRINDVTAHSDSFRANGEMAVKMAEFGDLESALYYSDRAHDSIAEPLGDLHVRKLALACISGRSIPSGSIFSSEATNSNKPIVSVPNLHLLIRSLTSDRCKHMNREEIANQFVSLFLRKDSEVEAVADVYTLLSMLESELERYEHAYAYNSRVLQRAPDNVRGLLMQLHFTTALGRLEEAEALKQELLSLQSTGKLSHADQKTLALYLKAD